MALIASFVSNHYVMKIVVVTTFKMLTSAANYQPAFLVAVIACKENTLVHLSEANGVKAPKETNLVDAVLESIGRSNDLIKSQARYRKKISISSDPLAGGNHSVDKCDFSC